MDQAIPYCQQSEIDKRQGRCRDWTDLRFPASVSVSNSKRFKYRSLGHCDLYRTDQTSPTVC